MLTAHHVPDDPPDEVLIDWGLAEVASVITYDSPSQAAAHPAPIFPGGRSLTDLGAVINGAASGRSSPGDITLHCPVGLAGTEVILAALLGQNTHE